MTEDQLTLDDPVSEECLQDFHKIQEAQKALGLDLLRLEKRKIAILAASKRLEDQNNRLFEGLLVARGCSPDLKAVLDAQTGMLSVRSDDDEGDEEEG